VFEYEKPTPTGDSKNSMLASASANQPLFHAYGLKLSPFPLVSTRKGPISCVAPYPTEEQPGPIYTHYSDA